VLHVVKLTDDYLACTSDFYKFTNAPGREAPVMLKHQGCYCLITSAQSGWKFNRANYCRAVNIFGPYAGPGDPRLGPEAATTYNSQGTQADAVAGKKARATQITPRWVKLQRCAKSTSCQDRRIGDPGVRPSPGAASLERATAIKSSRGFWHFHGAAPEDGRTPSLSCSPPSPQ
jgi:hypothetical protein